MAGGLIGRSGKRGGYDCDAALERHLTLVQNGQYQPVHHTAARTIPAQQYVPVQQYYAPVQSYAQPVMYVEQKVAVQQRAVVREYVTEEYVEEPVFQPAPVKRVKRVPIYVKGQ